MAWPGRGDGRRVLAAARPIRLFPTLPGGLVVAVVALVAGAQASRAATLGAAIALLLVVGGALRHAAIGPPGRDPGDGWRAAVRRATRQPVAMAALAVGAGGGLALSLEGGPALVLMALAVLALGTWHGLGAGPSRLSWLPAALGAPLLPAFGWYGAAGALPADLLLLLPGVALGGAALALASAAADLEADAAAGVVSVAVQLGPARTGAVVLLVQVLEGVWAVGSGAGLGASGPWLALAALAALVPIGGAGAGLLLAHRGPSGREIALEVQAVGLALLAAAWVNAVSAAAASASG